MSSHPSASRTSGGSGSRPSTTGRQSVTGRNTLPTASASTPSTPVIELGPAPTISAGPSAGTPTSTTVSISWTVSRVATGQIEYGPTASYGTNSALEGSYVYSTHVQVLTGLSPNTTYHYRVHSTTEDGQGVYSTDATFTTASSGLVFPTNRAQLTKGSSATPWSVPAQNGSVTVTDFDTCRVTRISDVTTYYMTYPVLQSWNADDTYLAIIAGGAWRLYSGTYPYNFVRTFSFGVSRNAAIWSGVNPDHLFACHQSSNTIMRYVASTNTTTTLRTFSNYSIVYAGDSSTMGDNGYIFLKGKRVSTNLWWIICYDTVNDVIISERVFPHPLDGSNLEMKNVHTSRSGSYGIVTYGNAGGATVTQYAMYQVDTTCAVVRNLFGTGSSNAVPHMSPGTTNATGQDCIVYFPGYMRNLVTGATTDLFPYATNKNDLNVQHVNTGTPGWAVFSQGQNNGRTAANVWGFDQLYQVRLDGTGVVREWAWARGVVDEPYYGSTGPDKDVYASASRGGDKIAFKSRNLASTSTSTKDGHLYIADVT